MRGVTHLVIGLFVALLILEFTDVNSLALVIIVLVASLLPDIDERHSLIGRKFPLVGWFSRHRGFFHSVYPAIIFSLVIFLFSNMSYASAFFIGYFIHLVFDAMTRSGISFFMVGKKVKGLFRTGGIVDYLLLFIFLVLSILLIL